MGGSGARYPPDLPLQPRVSDGASQKSSEIAQFKSYQGIFLLAFSILASVSYCNKCVLIVEFHKYVNTFRALCFLWDMAMLHLVYAHIILLC